MSNLPPAAEIREAIRIRIEQVIVNQHPWELEHVAFDQIVNGATLDTYTPVYKVEDTRIDGQLPSKAFFNANDELILTFYCSPSLPNRARPFAGGPVYVMWFNVPTGTTIEYDGEVRLFIDQVQGSDHTIRYIVMFGQEQYEQIVLSAPRTDSKAGVESGLGNRVTTRLTLFQHDFT
jgi:hypothetical protein